MKYEYNDTTQISPHFNAKEFRCKCGKAHDFEVNPTLVDKLEKLELVSRVKSEKDSRVYLVSLTVKGKSYEQLFNQIAENMNSRLMNNLSEDEANLLEKLLTKAISGFNK